MGKINMLGRYVTIIVGLATAGIICFSVEKAPAASFLNSCTTYCHGMPPRDAVRKGNPHYKSMSSSFSGNHQTHMSASPAAADCSACHTPVAANSFGHQNERIELQANIHNSPAGGKYLVSGSAVTFKNQTSIPLLGSCSSVNCHFEKQTPLWGTAPFSSPADCAACHGAPPTGGATGTAGSHTRHADYYPGTANCLKCHPDHPVEARPFAHATSAGRPVRVQGYMRDPQNSPAAAGTYSGTGANYLPSQSSSQVFGVCANLYCHSSGQSTTGSGAGTTVTTPLWGSGALNCGSCHKNMDTDAAATGSHVKHAQVAAIACASCHAGFTETTVTTTSHVNKNIDLGFTGPATGTTYGKGTGYIAGSSAYASCSTSYCHSSVQGSGGVGTGTGVTTPAWGASGSLNCGSCHVDMATSPAATGSHTKHSQTYTFACGVCHGSGYTAATVVYPGHVNNTIDLNMNGLAAGTVYSKTASFAPGVAYGSCSTSYCHSNGQNPPVNKLPNPVWGNIFSADCTGCHDSKRTSMTPSTLSGKHDRHLNYSTNTTLGRGNSFNCVDCHAKTVSSNTVISDRSKHVNQLIDYSGAKAGRSTNYSASTKVCNNIYCHSNGNPTALVFVTMSGSKAWNGSASLGCNGCHGRKNSLGTPDYTNGGPGSATANSHPKHVTAAGIVDTRGCTNCHAKTADPAVAGKFKDYSAGKYHLNRNLDVFFKPIDGKTGTFNGSSCSATYCHGSNPSPVWGATSALACDSCHSASNVLPGAHAIHLQTAALASSYTNMSGNVSTAASYRFSCAACHSPLGGALHANGPANSLGSADVFFGFTSATRKGSYSYGSTPGAPADKGFTWSTGGVGCNTTYCHSNGSGGNGAAVVSWTTTVITGNCIQCHGDATSLTSGTHAKHVSSGGKGLGCVECHAKTVSSNTVISNKAKHINKFKEYSGLRAGGSASYNQTTKSCATSYCHSNGKGLYVAPVWTNAASGACGTCHAAVSPVILTKAHFGHFSSTYGPRLSRLEATCANCHSYTNELAATHVNGSVDVNAATATCTTQCHRNTVPVWAGGTRLACESCHDGSISFDGRFGNISAPRKSMATFNANGHGKYNAYYCTACHSSTAKHISGVRHDSDRLGAYETNQNGLCASCHNNAAVVANVARRNMVTHVTVKDGAANALCSVCHNTHGTGNYASLVASISFSSLSAPVKITHPAAGLNFIDTVTQRGFCQVCHTATNHYRRGKAESAANNGWNSSGYDHSSFTAVTNCLVCHDHNGGTYAFAMSGGSCDTCHGYPPVPRNTAVVINRFGNYTNAGFQNYTGGGGAHAINNHVPKTARASDGWSANCSKCHNQADHQMSPIVFKPSQNIKVRISQRYRLETAKQTRYTSNRLDGAQHRPGTCSNISCHYGATPAWNQR